MMMDADRQVRLLRALAADLESMILHNTVNIEAVAGHTAMCATFLADTIERVMLLADTVSFDGSEVFELPNNRKAIDPETCPHPWDTVHYVDETGDRVVCNRCGKELRHEDPKPILPDSERATQAPVHDPSGGESPRSPDA